MATDDAKRIEQASEIRRMAPGRMCKLNPAEAKQLAKYGVKFLSKVRIQGFDTAQTVIGTLVNEPAGAGYIMLAWEAAGRWFFTQQPHTVLTLVEA